MYSSLARVLFTRNTIDLRVFSALRCFMCDKSERTLQTLVAFFFAYIATCLKRLVRVFSKPIMQLLSSLGWKKVLARAFL